MTALTKVIVPVMEWQPVTGCSPISTGCANCYAMKLAGEQLKTHPSRVGLTKEGPNGPVWNGDVRFNEQWIEAPLSREARHAVYVCPHGDLFHEHVQTAWQDAVFSMMERCQHHIFMVLTKRAETMSRYVNARYPSHAPDHIHLGVSAERQQEADERIPHLLDARAVVRYVTFFPLLGPIDVRRYLKGGRISYVNAGEEAQRPAKHEWSDDIAEACASFSIPFTFGRRLSGEGANG